MRPRNNTYHAATLPCRLRTTSSPRRVTISVKYGVFKMGLGGYLAITVLKTNGRCGGQVLSCRNVGGRSDRIGWRSDGRLSNDGCTCGGTGFLCHCVIHECQYASPGLS